MKKLNFSLKLVFCIFFISCQNQPIKYKHVVYQNNKVNFKVLKTISNTEKALLTMYLFAYGNECSKKETAKCKILKNLNISNECNTAHINTLKKWFKKDYLFQLKLNNCPVLPNEAAIQNKFEYIKIIRNQDTITIQYNLKGMNNSQEKSWNFNRIDSYLIKNKMLIKLKNEDFY